MNRHDRIFWMGLVATVGFVLYLLVSPIRDYPPPHPPMSDPDYPRYTTTINKDIYGRAG